MIVVLIALGVFVVGALVGLYSDYRVWNGGVCARTGLPWKYFASDSQGGRGYRSEDCVCWISYPFIDRKRQ